MKRKEAYMDDLRPIVYLVGIGMGGEDQLTGRAMDCLEAAQVVMGADRMLDSVSAYTDKKPISQVRWFSGWAASGGMRQPWCCRETPAFTAGLRRRPRHLCVKDGTWNLCRVCPACPISAPDWERAGRMFIRSAAMDGSVMWWPI